MNAFVKSLLDRKIVSRKTINDVDCIVLTKPTSILITKSIQERIKAVYPVSSEIGGCISMKVLEGGSLASTNVYFFRNTQTDSSKYSPDYSEFYRAVQLIQANNELPFFFHTHPTKLGINGYDFKSANFYLTSSLQDRDASFYPIMYSDVSLVMPQSIFVRDERFTGGLGVGMYSGDIFPLSFNRLGNVEIIALEIVSLIVFVTLLNKKYSVLKFSFLIVAIVIVYYLYHKPKYTSRENGDVLITV